MRIRFIVIVSLLVVACTSGASTENEMADVAASATSETVATTTLPPATTSSPTFTIPPTSNGDDGDPVIVETSRDPSSSPPPSWLGERELPLRPGEDNGVAQQTPPELVDRRLWTTDVLPPPAGEVFESTIETPPPIHVVRRSTWTDECPVPLDQLSYATVSFVGFDGLFHTGEFILNRDIAPRVVTIFEQLHTDRFPIEQMLVTSQEMLDAPVTGDSNNTSSFACRAAVNSGSWSRHAHGGAIDINPFHNPYVKDDLVIPELASAYLDRDRVLPGMVTPEIVARFSELGWGWGGDWNSASDWMHFSDNGR